jgi:sarcosine oxidase subunit gamma
MADPVARSPLDHLADTLAAAGGPDVELGELPFLAQVGLRADPAEIDAAALGLPTAPNTVGVRDDGGRSLWLGPREWLVVGAPGRTGAIAAELEAATAGAFATVLDLSANRTTLELAGPRARDVLATGCSIDLHPRAFGPGRCAQTTIARTQVILDQVGDRPAFRLHVRGSFAAHLAAWLADAMGEYAVPHPHPRSRLSDPSG